MSDDTWFTLAFLAWLSVFVVPQLVNKLRNFINHFSKEN